MSIAQALLHVKHPKVNGPFEAGIAVGLDPGLWYSLKLPIVPGDYGDKVRYIAAWVLRNDDIPIHMKKWYLAGAWAALSVGLIRRYGGLPDGDWVDEQAVSIVHTQETKDLMNVARQLAPKALTLIVGAKANWWNTNHHTGEGEATGHVKKLLVLHNLDTKFGMQMMHTIAQWSSTRFVLHKANIPGIVPTEVVCEHTHQLTITNDRALWFEGLPVGAHEVQFAHAALKRCVMCLIFRYAPYFDDFSRIPSEYNKAYAQRAMYHVEARYLTGYPKVECGDRSLSCLGRLGTIIRIVYPKSILAKSPHFASERVTSYEDYSPEFASLVRSWLSIRPEQRLAALANIPMTSEEAIKALTDAVNEPCRDDGAGTGASGSGAGSVHGEELMPVPEN